jgi:hypothetical protein
MLLRRLNYPKTTGLILRRTYPELYRSHIVKLFEECPQVRQWYNEQRKEIVFPNGSRLFFGSAEHEKDMSSFYSAEFADIMVDEAQEFSQGELENLSGSNRCTSNGNINPAILYTFMPGMSESGLPPKGLSYLKRVLVDADRRGEENRQKWTFLQAFSWDNIEWARKEMERDGVSEEEFYSWPNDVRREYFIERTEYGASLAAITNTYLREAWLFGKWGVFQGQYFPNFSYEKHTKDAAEISIKPWHKCWISGDWGHDHPACIHLHSEDEKGHITTFAELWGREIGEAELGRRIGEMCGERRFVEFWLSWDAFGKLNPATRKSITEMIGAALPVGIPKPTPADASPGSRISGWRLMHQLLDANMWTISRDCPKLIECLPTLIRDMDRNSEDVLKVDYSENYVGDDAADSARYGLQNMLSPSGKPFTLRVEERLQQIRAAEPEASWTHLMMAKAKIEHEETMRTPRPTRMKRHWRFARPN